MNILLIALVQCQAAINSKYVITLQTSCSTWPEPEPFPPLGSVLYVIIIACGARGKRDLFLRHMQLQQRQQQKQQQLPCCRCAVAVDVDLWARPKQARYIRTSLFTKLGQRRGMWCEAGFYTWLTKRGIMLYIYDKINWATSSWCQVQAAAESV